MSCPKPFLDLSLVFAFTILPISSTHVDCGPSEIRCIYFIWEYIRGIQIGDIQIQDMKIQDIQLRDIQREFTHDAKYSAHLIQPVVFTL